MARHEVVTQWMGKMQFNALVNGHTVIMDAPERSGGEDAGPIPKPFVLTALAGCTGMDVVALLRKQSVVLHSFTMRVEGELSRHAPIEYIAAHVYYEFEGAPEHESATAEAVRQSQEQFCGVSHMLKKAIPVTWSILYNNKEIFNNSQISTAESK